MVLSNGTPNNKNNNKNKKINTKNSGLRHVSTKPSAQRRSDQNLTALWNMDHKFGKQRTEQIWNIRLKLESRTKPVYVEQNKFRIWNPEQIWNMQNISKRTRNIYQY